MKAGQIILTLSPETVDIAAPRGALCIHHRSLFPRQGWDGVTFEDFARDPRKWTSGRPGLVIMGMTLARTPSNRAREFWDSIEHWPGPKWSIDRTVFIAEPWRTVWQFNLMGHAFGIYTYSYLAETHWRAHADGLRDDDPFSEGQIAAFGDGIVQCDYDRFFDLHTEVVPLGEEVHAAYQVEKTKAFAEEATPSAIIRRLSAFATQACPRRHIPSTRQLFYRQSHRILATDLRVDAYLTGQLDKVGRLTNQLATRFSWSS